MTEIVIDDRESGLKILVQKVLEDWGITNIKLKECRLNLGDVIIQKNSIPRIIIERKSLNDLAGSICDGRYKEQSYRLTHSCLHNHNIIYLIEGKLDEYNSTYTNIEKRTLLSCLVSLNHYKGFSVNRTTSIQESSEWVVNLADKLGREQSSSYYNCCEESTLNDNISYAQVYNKKKKSYITKDNVSSIMLSQIPGVSVLAAVQLMSKYGNLKNLIEDLENYPNTIKDTKITGLTGKKRKISKTACDNIRNYLLP